MCYFVIPDPVCHPALDAGSKILNSHSLIAVGDKFRGNDRRGAGMTVRRFMSSCDALRFCRRAIYFQTKQVGFFSRILTNLRRDIKVSYGLIY